MLRKISFALITVLLLAGCGSKSPVTPSPTPQAKFVIPTDCTATHVNAAVEKIATGSAYIPTQWQPSQGSELADFLNNGGIACSYGLQNAEIGVTAKWVDDAQGLFEKHEDLWQKDGYTKVDLPEIDEDAAYFYIKPQSPSNEFHLWSLNVKYRGAWLQLNCTAFAQSLEAGLPILRAMIQE